MTVHQGEWVAIVGPSGSGKTTLLAILGLLDTPSSGSYLLGRPARCSGLSASQRAWVRNRQIGFIFQSFNLIGDLTVFENVELPLTYRGHAGGRAQAAGGHRAGARGHGAPAEAPPRPALRRSAAARGGGPRRGRRPAAPPRRRAHRKPRLQERPGGDGAAARAARRRRHAVHGHPRPRTRQAGHPRGEPLRRPGGGGRHRAARSGSSRWSRPETAAGALALVATTVLLAAGVRLSEDPALAAAARAVRTRPLEHALAAAGWAVHALDEPPGPERVARARCQGRRWR